MNQILSETLAHFGPADYVALGTLIIGIFASTILIENPPKSWPSTHVLMREFRQRWMREMAQREVRIFDAQIIGSLRQGASFFASTALIAIGGGAAILGQTDRVQQFVSDLTPDLAAPKGVIEIRMLLVLSLLTLAFLKFVWSIRLFGYCAVVMSALPDHTKIEPSLKLAATAAEININADRAFTRGLRAVYFSLAALAWFLGPYAMMLATGFVLIILARREFNSATRDALLQTRDLT